MNARQVVTKITKGEWDGKELLSDWERSFLYALLRGQGAINHGRATQEKIITQLTDEFGVSRETVLEFLQPQSLFVFPMMRRMASLAWSMKRAQWFRKLFPKISTTHVWEQEVIPYIAHGTGQQFTALVDLGAFIPAHMDITLGALKEQGVRTVVIMEDRNPRFFLNYHTYTPEERVPLNRHGPHHDEWTQEQLHIFVDHAHTHGIRVVLGFWCNYASLHWKPQRVRMGHRNNPFIQRNTQALAPIVPGSDDMNVYAYVEDHEGNRMQFATYIGTQFQRLAADFGFDGLFIGDGGMGMRNFLNLDSSWDFTYLQKVTYDFYREIYRYVHAEEGRTLYAYDCNGYGYDEALRRGVSYRSLLGGCGQPPCLDHLVVQMYPEAWGNYMRVWDRRDQHAVRKRVEQVLERTQGAERSCMLTLEIGDDVEGWRVTPKQMKEQIAYFERLSKTHAFDILGVWCNAWIAERSKEKENA